MFVEKCAPVLGTGCDIAPLPNAMTMKGLPLILVILSFQLTASAQYTATVKTSVVKSDVAGWRKWSNGVATIDYPSTWSSEGTGPNDLTASFTAPTDSSGRSPVKVELHVRPAAGMTLSQYLDHMKERLAARDKQAAVQDAQSWENGCSLEYTTEVQGRPVRVKQQARIKDGQAWVLSFISEPAHFDDQLYLAEAMFASFSVK